MRLIDADALLREIRCCAARIIFRGCETMITGKDSCNPAEWTRGYEQGVIDTANVIESQKTIEAEPVKRGRWEDGMKCSECGQIDWTKPNYCPNCGAKMESEGE